MQILINIARTAVAINSCISAENEYNVCMKNRIALVLMFVLAGCGSSSRVPKAPSSIYSRLPSYSPFSSVKRQIDSLLPDTLFPPGGVSVRVVSLSSGEILYDLDADLSRNPASNLKLLTTALALQELGATYSFSTIAFADTSGRSRILLRASGDPLLSSPDLDTLARRIAERIPKGRMWTVAADISLFDDQERGKGWMWDDEPDPTAMFISPLSLDGNCIRVLVKPGRIRGESVIVSTEPATSFVTVENSAVTNPDLAHRAIHISRNWHERSNRIVVSGEMSPYDSLVTETLSVAEPTWYAMTVLTEDLRKLGISCGPMAVDTIPHNAFELARIEHTLDTVITYMNQTSDNLAAENLLKVIAGTKAGISGSAAEGIQLLRKYLAMNGIDTAKTVIADGSGVSRYNLVSAALLVRLLATVHARPDLFPLWYKSLPLAGVSGTLSRRMRGTPAEGNVHAKTGTLEGVSSISGYVTTADGELLAFSILMEHFPNSSRLYRQSQDRICEYLATLRRSSN
jgi:D-alanyl-D-alanine carboxypeptidase/D-alanyl-D-alanine-endopeptidase (penicillin-binding protein 4)